MQSSTDYQNTSYQADANVRPKFTCNNPTIGDRSLVPPLTTVWKMQHPAMGDQSLVPPQTTAAKMQNNNKSNQNISQQEVPNPTGNSTFSCKDCSFTCSSLQNFRIHFQTEHHNANENVQKTSTLNIAAKLKEKVAPNIQSGTVDGNSGRNIAKLKDYISRADREPLIGLEYVLEYRFKAKGNIETRYFCELCECDTDVDPMVEHLAGFGHRKLYLAKEYPYVLKAQSNIKEDQSEFIRRMALEIEREDGTKTYMIDPSIWLETMITLRTADKKIKKKTRWDDDKNDQTRMKKALNFLGTFEIESEIEATTVARLCEKLTVNLKLYNNKAKADALFPARVARAQDVAMSLIKNAARQRTHLQNPNQKKGKSKRSQKRNQRPSNLPENVNLKNKGGMQSGFSGKNFQNMNAKQNMPTAPQYWQAQNARQNMPMAPPYQQAHNARQNMPMAPPYQQAHNAKQNMPMAPPYQQAQKYPFDPLKEKQARQMPSMDKMKENLQKIENPQSDDSFLKNISQEDTQFLKKLMVLLEALPQNVSPSEAAQMNSKLLMLKSLLVNQKNKEHEQANEKLMMQIASMVQDSISAQSASLNQQLMMLMTSQNSTAMVMQTASHRNKLMGTDGFIPGAGLPSGIQSSGTIQTNVNSLMPFNQSFGRQTYGQMEGNELRPMDQNAYQVTQVEMQNYPSTSQDYPSSSQMYDNFGYGNSGAGTYLPQGNPYVSQKDGTVNSLTSGQNEQKLIPYTDVGYESSVGNRDWDNSYYGNPSTQVQDPKYVDRSKEKATYTRVSLSPSSLRNQNDYNDDTREVRTQDLRQRPGSKSYSSSDWDDQEGDLHYNKRPKLDVNNRSNRSESYHNESLESLGINTSSMPEELIKRIQGKDLFTASAIISEYSEGYSGK